MMDSFQDSALRALIVLFIGIVLSFAAPKLIGPTLKNLAKRTKSQTDDYIISKVISIIKPVGLVISFSLFISTISLGKRLENIFLSLPKLVLIIILVQITNKILIRILNRWSQNIDDIAFSEMLKSLAPMIKSIIWCLGTVIYLQNIGVQMAAVWAILSAGGIGAGLALKDPVQEFFEYIIILLDKPFQNGQFININNVWAKVERVGVRSTRLRSLNGETIVMSNTTLTNGTISNYAEMESRRLVHKLGVVYDTEISKLKKIPKIIETIVDNTQDAKFDRCHFTDFGDFSLDFELVYFIPTNNYLRAMEAQQSINLEIMTKFEDEKISFAFPTQTLNLIKN